MTNPDDLSRTPGFGMMGAEEEHSVSAEPHIDDPNHWRRRAEQMRKLAGETQVAEAKRYMLQVARDYEKFVIRAEQRTKGETT